MTKAELLALCEPLPTSVGGVTPLEGILMLYKQEIVCAIDPVRNRVLMQRCYVIINPDWDVVQVYRRVNERHDEAVVKAHNLIVGLYFSPWPTRCPSDVANAMNDILSLLRSR